MKKKKEPLISSKTIKGANLIKQDSLFILDGIHKKEIEKTNSLVQCLEKYNVNITFTQKQLNW